MGRTSNLNMINDIYREKENRMGLLKHRLELTRESIKRRRHRTELKTLKSESCWNKHGLLKPN